MLASCFGLLQQEGSVSEMEEKFSSVHLVKCFRLTTPLACGKLELDALFVKTVIH